MLVVIRADASQVIGSGHIMRCLTLARRLKTQGADVCFICRDLSGNLSEFIYSQGFEVYLLPRLGVNELDLTKTELPWEEPLLKLDAVQTMNVIKGLNQDIASIIVDHYRIDYRWQLYFKAQVRNIMVIDDLANRRHECDILLDQNYYPQAQGRYGGLVPETCSLFLGPRYLLLRDEFYQTQKNMRIRTGNVLNVLIFYGGADPTHETEKCLKALRDSFRQKFVLHVVTAHSNSQREMIKEICASKPNIHYHCQVSNMAELINKADLAFGAGGSNTWERCFLGLPSIVTITAKNQLETTVALSELGAICNLGWYEGVTGEALVKATKEFITEPSKLRDMANKSLELIGINNSLGIDELVKKILQD
ncbi:pseudaminic acid biosynthesis-associated protein PseG [Desulfosporosinus acidiphilus SJ4]|uniref:Pseudaminic acid biosynthesis-associated protein PseG n=1 Tax=Desulfosporosinus acidiphilus (strain DSM 22704 / JCM 16185 / SJ4) TaxID=646529 RepID=I4DA98_DESAJ|nr:UDP-2,4-diacetamido-2,4,6-trideoxy-beta-L-altropyranose hydrolase [Desulfosporosinus acidiphilus]AFM42722.1 pseudaminic acid biosynthesis-associated protein PseG [Desulfosporosinus acidiphilus SJ4]